jgi:cell division protein FtsB
LLNRLLLSLLPDKQITLLAWGVGVIAILLGLMHMLSRDFNSARFYLNLALAIMASPFLLRFLSLRATYQVAEHAQTELRQHIKHMQHAADGVQERARERAEMVALADELRQALNNLEPDSPVRPKYEATLELLMRMHIRA